MDIPVAFCLWPEEGCVCLTFFFETFSIFIDVKFGMAVPLAPYSLRELCIGILAWIFFQETGGLQSLKLT